MSFIIIVVLNKQIKIYDLRSSWEILKTVKGIKLNFSIINLFHLFLFFQSNLLLS